MPKQFKDQLSIAVILFIMVALQAGILQAAQMASSHSWHPQSSTSHQQYSLLASAVSNEASCCSDAGTSAGFCLTQGPCALHGAQPPRLHAPPAASLSLSPRSASS